MLIRTFSWLFVGSLHYFWHFSKSAATRSTLLRTLKVHHSLVISLLEEVRKMNKALSIQGGVAESWDLFLFLQLSADVYRIHSLPHGGLLVLFRGGGVRTLDELLEAPQQEIENVISGEAIRWVMPLCDDSCSEELTVMMKVVPSSEEMGGNQKPRPGGWVFSSNTLFLKSLLIIEIF